MELAAVLVLNAIAALGAAALGTLAARRIRWMPAKLIGWFTGTDGESSAVPWILGAVAGLLVEIPRILLAMVIVGRSFSGDSLAWWVNFRLLGVPVMVYIGFLAGTAVGDTLKKATLSEEGSE